MAALSSPDNETPGPQPSKARRLEPLSHRVSETDWRHREIITALGLPFASPGFSQRRQLCKIWRPCARAAAADLLCSAKHTFGGCDSATAYIGAGGQGVHRRESNAPRAHGRSVRRVAASDRKSDPERESGHGVNHGIRQPQRGTDLCLDVLPVGSFF